MSSPARPGPTEGEVFFRGSDDLTRLDEAAIANLGIGRKFQKPTVFESLTVFENLELALEDAARTWRTLFAGADRRRGASASRRRWQRSA